MREITVTPETEGQRLERMLERCLPHAPRSFLYRMMRKKNITLNGKKASGNEILRAGDAIRIWFSDETMEKFSGNSEEPSPSTAGPRHSGKPGGSMMAVPRHSGKPGRSMAAESGYPEKQADVSGCRKTGTQAEDQDIIKERAEAFSEWILYEDDHILILNKPAGLLTQKASTDDVSLNEYLICYLLHTGQTDYGRLRLLRPSACNRLDRNTSGIVTAGKTHAGLQSLTEMFRDRTGHKYYHCLASGRAEGDHTLDAVLRKDHAGNKAEILPAGTQIDGGQDIRTHIRVLNSWKDAEGFPVSLLEAELITGRSHQIRASLASAGLPLIGDGKYGDPEVNRRYRRLYGIRAQLLHAARLVFPENAEGCLSALSGEVFYAPWPHAFQKAAGGRFPDKPGRESHYSAGYRDRGRYVRQ